MDLRTAAAVMGSQRGGRSKLRLDRRGQPAEKASRQARVVAEHDPAGMSTIRHGLDIASRRHSDNKRECAALGHDCFLRKHHSLSAVMPREGGASGNRKGAVGAVPCHWISSGVLDRPPEPVIGPAKGRTRWRAMTASIVANAPRIKTAAAAPSGRCLPGAGATPAPPLRRLMMAPSHEQACRQYRGLGTAQD